MDLSAFFNRIHYAGSIEPGEKTLVGIHRAFVATVPFENLDIHHNRPITLDVQNFFDKIVHRRRGGFCFELNGLFAEVLRQLGFKVTLLSARVFDANSVPGREFGHLCLAVDLENRWLADVGFGDASPEPLRIDFKSAQLIEGTNYRLRSAEDHRLIMEQQSSNGSWRGRYSVSLVPRSLEDFAAICHDLQTAEDSFFRLRRLCTLRTLTEKRILCDNTLTVIRDNHRTETLLQDDHALRAALLQHFGINITAPETQSSSRHIPADRDN
jgi:N-hydroxyarylamine O-acetyltransferase